MSNTAKIVSIAKVEPVEEVVDMCQRLLKLAESGEMRSLTWIAEIGGNHENGYAGDRMDRFKILGQACRLIHRINEHMDTQTTWVPRDPP